MTYTKDSKMPFGKHEGKKLSEVPASHLIWCRENIKKLDYGLRNYIDENMAELTKRVAEGKDVSQSSNNPYTERLHGRH